MPLHKIEWTNHQSGWALWHVTEPEEDLANAARPEVCPEDITNTVKRREWLAGRILIKMLVENTGLVYKGLRKDDYGKPFLVGLPHHISLSHSFPYIACQFDQQLSVGIDIEQPKEKLLRIAPRIFSLTERNDAGNDVIKNCIYWCAKESLYKIYGKRSLSFASHLRVHPFTLQQSGTITGSIVIANEIENVLLNYRVQTDYVLVMREVKRVA